LTFRYNIIYNIYFTIRNINLDYDIFANCTVKTHNNKKPIYIKNQNKYLKKLLTRGFYIKILRYLRLNIFLQKITIPIFSNKKAIYKLKKQIVNKIQIKKADSVNLKY